MAIYPQNNDNDTKWGRGGFGAMIKSMSSDKPLAYCDGSDSDEQELLKQAEDEGLGGAEIQRKSLKTGREVWTVIGDYDEEE